MLRKSTLSHTNGCVEVAFVDGRVAVHDSKEQEHLCSSGQ
jgi:hypothetical protein